MTPARRGRAWAAALGALIAAPAPAAGPPDPIVRIETAAGVIRARVALARAPVTACNFLRYVTGRYYDGGAFFRTVRSDRAGPNPVPIDVIQLRARDGEEADAFGPIRLERTSITGLHHVRGALSMARWGPDTATSSFSIVTRDSPSMDFGGSRNRDGQGFAVFGQVVAGWRAMDRIHRAAAEGETLVPTIAVRRIALEAPLAPALHRRCAHAPAPGGR